MKKVLVAEVYWLENKEEGMVQWKNGQVNKLSPTAVADCMDDAARIMKNMQNVAIEEIKRRSK